MALNPAGAVRTRVVFRCKRVSRDAAAGTSGGRFNVTRDARFHE
jgi:hypothetical protein